MKRLIFFFALTLMAVTYSNSCSVDNNASKSTASAYSYYTTQGFFVTDDSIRVYPNNSISEISTGSKVWIMWSYEKEKGITDPTYADISTYSGMMQSTAFKTEQPDTLGTDGADLYFIDGNAQMWKSGGVYGAPVMFNINFYFITCASSSDHTVYLTYTSNPVDTDGYFHVKFSHSAGSDINPDQSGQTFCAFTLPEEAYPSKVKGLVITFDGMEKKESKPTYRYTFATAKTEIL